MFRNYLKIAIRNLKKQKLHSFINIAGLAVGMAVSILILSYVWYELSFDRFHSKFGQIYRVIDTRHTPRGDLNFGWTGSRVAVVLKEEFPEIIQSAHFRIIEEEVELSYNDRKFIEEPGCVLVAHPEIFDIFDINLTLGDPETALLDPKSIILTEEESRKYFGNESPIGKFINIRVDENYFLKEEIEENLMVTGVAKAMPANSHFSFKFIIHRKKLVHENDFFRVGAHTYLTLPVGYPPEKLEEKFPEIMKKYYAPEIEDWFKMTYDEWLEQGYSFKLELQQLKHIHLDSHYQAGPFIKKGNLFHIQIYTVIALFIIALACINFITLSTARSGARAKEVGIRKVTGARRVQLIWQFLTESILLSVIALVFAIIMVAIFSKPFNNLLEIQTSHNNAGIVFIGLSLFAVTLIVGVIAGSYPAFFLSAFRPVNVLKGKLLEKMKGMKIRNSLVVFQFMVSIILIISSIAVYKQFVYMQNKELGFDKENIIIIRNLSKNLGSQGGETLPFSEREFRTATFQQEVLKSPSVTSASLMLVTPGKWERGYFNNDVHLLEGVNAGTTHRLWGTVIDHNYLDVFGLEMVAGENFRKDPLPQTMEGVIINEKAVDFLGFKNPIGKYIDTYKWVIITNKIGEEEGVEKEYHLPIIGVFKDFHNRSLHEIIKPTIYYPNHKGYINHYPLHLAVRLLPGNIPDNIAFLEKKWNKFITDAPFEFSFFDKEFENLYNKEKKLGQIFTFFTILAIFIACLGIFGLAAFTAEQRTKEIGIRKVLGASIRNIVEILSKIYLKLLIVAILFACPLGYIVMNKWLQNFTFHTNIGAAIFIYTGLITTIIVLSSVTYHSIKAALTNPARSLKYE